NCPICCVIKSESPLDFVLVKTNPDFVNNNFSLWNLSCFFTGFGALRNAREAWPKSRWRRNCAFVNVAKGTNDEKNPAHRQRRRGSGAVPQAPRSGAAPGRIRRVADLARGGGPNHAAVKNIFFMVGRIEETEPPAAAAETAAAEENFDHPVNQDFLQSIKDPEIRAAFARLLKSYARRQPKV